MACSGSSFCRTCCIPTPVCAAYGAPSGPASSPAGAGASCHEPPAMVPPPPCVPVVHEREEPPAPRGRSAAGRANARA
eukprot:9185281-Lingulodinium_polyedra.AAC.1